MAKRKLHGAALAAYNRKRGLGGSSRSRSIARRGGGSVVVVRTSSGKPARRRGRRRGSSGGSGAVRPLRSQFRDLLGAAGYGFLTGDHNKAPQITAMVNKVPTLSAIGAPASHGLLLHFIATKTGGMVRRVAGHLSHAALMHAAHNLGITGGDYTKAATLSGEGDEDYLAGDMDLIEGDDDDQDDDVNHVD